MQDHYPPLVLDKINVEMLEAKGANYLGMVIAQKQEPQAEKPTVDAKVLPEKTENTGGWLEGFERAARNFWTNPDKAVKKVAEISDKVIKNASSTYSNFLATINSDGMDQKELYNVIIKSKNDPVEEENYKILYRLYEHEGRKYAVFTPTASNEPPYFNNNTAVALFKIIQYRYFTEKGSGVELKNEALHTRPDDLLIPYSFYVTGGTRHWFLHHVQPDYNESNDNNKTSIVCYNSGRAKQFDLSSPIKNLRDHFKNYKRHGHDLKHLYHINANNTEDSAPWLVQNINTILDRREPGLKDVLNKEEQAVWFTKNKNFVAPAPNFMERNKYKLAIFIIIALVGLAVGVAFALIPQVLAPLLYAGATKIGIDITALGTLSALQLGLFTASIATLINTVIVTTVLLLINAVQAIFKVATKSPLEKITLQEFPPPKADDFKQEQPSQKKTNNTYPDATPNTFKTAFTPTK